MEEHKVKILGIEALTHDVKRFTIEKPAGYNFVPGQATEVSVNKPAWKNEKRPFTFTGLNDAKDLEFVIKAYPSHKGVTNELHYLKVGDELIIHDVWGAIAYKGKGVFIAGGAGITPFIAIFRQLQKDRMLDGNKLVFSNKTSKDIILKAEFVKMLGADFIPVITEEKIPGVRDKRIDKEYLEEIIKDFCQHFYICGPEKFTESVHAALVELGAEVDSVILEK
jgi:ferredoxin-NADP reductase